MAQAMFCFLDLCVVGIYSAYTRNIHLISQVYIQYINSILHLYTTYIYHIHSIFMVYSIHIMSIYQLSTVTRRPILIEQLRSLSFQLSANLLCVSESEHLVSILQLIPGTPAGCALRSGTHCCSGHLIPVH